MKALLLLCVSLMLSGIDGAGRSYQYGGTCPTLGACQSVCENQGLSLATVVDAADRAAFVAAAQNANQYADNRRYVLGLRDTVAEGAWLWDDGASCNNGNDCIDYWSPNEPNDSGNNEDCIEVWFTSNGANVAANDLPCTNGGSWYAICNVATNQGCALNIQGATLSSEVVANQVYACSGTFAAGTQGLYGTGPNSAGALCNTGYGVCDSSDEAQGLGMTLNDCANLGSSGVFFGTRETRADDHKCKSEGTGIITGNVPTNDYNDVWGCGNGDTTADCGIFTYVIGNAHFGINNGWVYAGDHTDEAREYALTDAAAGGVICCADTTTTPTTTIASCGANQPATFDWDTLTEQGMATAGVNFDANTDVTFDLDASDLSLNIRVELPYFGKASADDEAIANFGVTYVLDFEDYDAHEDEISEPGTCQNRNDDDFGGAFSGFWDYSNTPLVDIGSSNYLAYPPPDGEVGDWNVSMADACDTVVYEGKFTWQDLRDCEPFGGGNSYTSIVTDADWLNLTGTFYINIVSPYWYDQNYNFYRVYQILSKPFIIAISSVVNVLGSTGINLMTMSVIAVYKEDEGPNPDSSRDYYADFKLVVLTECSDYMVLTRDAADPYVFTVPGVGGANSGTFSAPGATENAGCLNNKGFICSQLWEIEAIDVACTDSNGRDFSGNYQLTFEPACRPASDLAGLSPGDTDGSQLHQHCINWLAAHPQLTSGNYIQLNTDLVWGDEVCDPMVFIVRLEADMAFYSNDSFVAPVPDNYLYQVGEDTIYVEVTTDFPSDTLSVFDTEIMEVHICTFDPLLDPETNYNDPVNDIANFGCFNGARDTGYDQYFYKIFEDAGDHVSPPIVSLFGFTEYQDGIANTERFSFEIPSEVARDRLFIQVELEVELQELDGTPTRRRMLLNNRKRKRRRNAAHVNKLSHFIQPIGINHGQEIVKQPPNEEPEFKEPNNNNPPEQYYPPQQPAIPQQPYPVNPVTGPATYTINLSSPWVIALGGLLGLVLTFNIIFMTYKNCCDGSSQGRASFIPRRGRKKGYAKVNVESEFDSEAQMIQNEDDESQ